MEKLLLESVKLEIYTDDELRFLNKKIEKVLRKKNLMIYLSYQV